MKVRAFSVRYWAAALLVVLCIAACGSTGKFGAPIAATEETAINDVLDDPEEFAGKTVLLKGQIQTIDEDGKGFTLDNGLGTMIYVKVAGDFSIGKGAKYHLATAEGKIDVNKKTMEPRLLAAGVEVK